MLVSVNPPPFAVPADEADFNTPEGLARLEKGLRVPTLLVRGALDTSGTKEFAEEVASRVPEVEQAVIPRAGHAVNSDQPELFNSSVLEFLGAAKG